VASKETVRPDDQAAAVIAPALRMLYLLLSAGVLAADRLTKDLIASTMTLHESRPVIPGFFYIVYDKNQGIAFGLFADSPSRFKTFILIFLSSLALAGVAMLLWTLEHSSLAVNAGLALILGGALGNLVDRVQGGGVVDFIYFAVRDYYWPAFNFADSAIVAGGGLLLLHMLRGGHLEKVGKSR
jgi:signal peptidase II